jgi:hypothetical protein
MKEEKEESKRRNIQKKTLIYFVPKTLAITYNDDSKKKNKEKVRKS